MSSATIGNPCFSCCLPKSIEDDSDNDDDLLVRRKASARPPRYRQVRREDSRLLQAAWEEDWEQVLSRCDSHPHEAFWKTQHSKRTALHLATFNHPCPLPVAEKLIQTNQHMLVLPDANHYTPLHNVTFFAGESLIPLFCNLIDSIQQDWKFKRKHLPPVTSTSPLFLAAKRAAPVSTLRTLLATRNREMIPNWIAPWTGGEPYRSSMPAATTSPLEILVRERAVRTWRSATDFAPNTENELVPLYPAMRQIARNTLSKDDKVLQDDLPRLEPVSKSKVTKDMMMEEELEPLDEAEVLSLWEKAITLLMEFVPCVESINKDNTFAILHAIASLKVPVPRLLALAVKVYPEQCVQPDDEGCLPLHHALMAQASYSTHDIISILLAHGPSATHVPIQMPHEQSGATPLALALQQRVPWEIITSLLQIERHMTLFTMDKRTKLYPFAIAASHGYSLSNVYTLLRGHPQVLLGNVAEYSK